MTIREGACCGGCKDIQHGDDFLEALEGGFPGERFGRLGGGKGGLMELFSENAGEEVGGAGGYGDFCGAG